MKVLVVDQVVPFCPVKPDKLADTLAGKLRGYGHESEVFRIPTTALLPAARDVLLARLLEFEATERLVPLRFPSCLARFHKKAIWLAEDCGGPLGAPLKRIEAECYRSGHALFASTRNTATRLSDEYGVHAQLLLPPLANPELFVPKGDDGYVLALADQGTGGREGLLVEALAATPSSIRLVVTGPIETAAARRLDRLANRLGVADRVALQTASCDADLAELVGRARAVACLPAPGATVVTGAAMAFHCGKPVLTLADVPDLAELIADGQTGLVREPSTLADGLAAVGDPTFAIHLGRAAAETWTSRRVTWHHTIEMLLA